MSTHQRKYTPTRLQRFTSLCLVSVLAIALGTACSKKKKDGEGGDQDGAISDMPINFDAQGSDSGNISGLQTVFFPYDSSVLTPDARSQLQSNAEWIKSNSASVQVEGHTDERGSVEYNFALGERRAKAVRAYLVSLGVSASRLSVISYGEEKPLVSGDSEQSYARNRRANFLPIK